MKKSRINENTKREKSREGVEMTGDEGKKKKRK